MNRCLLVSLISFSTVFSNTHGEDLYNELEGIIWECTFRTVPRFRLSAEKKIELLDSKRNTTKVYGNAEPVGDRILRITYRDGGSLWYIFDRELQTCLLGNTKKYYTAEFLPDSDSAKISGHPDVTTVEVNDKTFNAGDTFGETLRYHPDVTGAVLSKNRAVLLVRSPEDPTKGWFIDGMHIGIAVRMDKGGTFTPTTRTKLTGYLGRSAQIPRILVRAGQERISNVHEAYVEQSVSHYYGSDSIGLLYGYRDMGLARGSARSFEKASHWHGKAFDLAKQHFQDKPTLIFETGSRYAMALSDSGSFDDALPVYKEIYPLREKLSDGKDDITLLLNYYDGLAKNAFARRDYPRAVNWFEHYIEVATANKYTGSEIAALIDITACHLASGAGAAAENTLASAIKKQNTRQKNNPKATYDTYKLSFACVALGKMKEAQHFGKLYNYKSTVRYTEYGHLLALWNHGETEKARALATKIADRIDNMENIQIRRDIDMMTILITKAIARNTPEAIAECKQEWQSQAINLKNRPLENYIFAKVLVSAMEKL